MRAKKFYSQSCFSAEMIVEMSELIDKGLLRPGVDQTYADAYLDYKRECDE